MEFNKAQKEAISHDKGPLLIVAGAGTGKTRVITSRIVDLIESEKAGADEILALTFTEKASLEMLERVDESMPLSYEDVCIKTFHSFSERVLREAGLEIGLDPGFKILSQVDQWFFMKKNLFNFDLNYYRPLGNPNRFIYDLLSHFSKLKDEIITPEKYLEYAEALEDGEDKDKILEIAVAYKTYCKLLIKSNYLDFGDLTYYTLQLFETRKSVLKEYQDRYKYILVDEFQDTNHAQFRLVEMISDGHKNLVVVGDDDQSIYKWRGASLSNILQFEKNFPKHKKVVLVENYRSSRPILDSAYGLIQNNNPDRLEVRDGISKKLKSNIEDVDPAEVHHFPNYVQESSFVAEKIESLHKNNDIPYGEFAILVRSNQLVHQFVEELKILGIPYQVRNPKGLLILDEIKDLLAVISVLSNPYDDISFLRILRMDVFDVCMQEIHELMKKAGNNHLFEYLRDLEDETQVLPGTESGIQKFKNLLIHLIEFSKKNSVGLVLSEFLNESGYLSYLMEKEMFEEVENINELAKHVSKFERDNEEHSVMDFSSYLDLLIESNSTLATDNTPDRDSVQILTIHGAKGLEFEAVFVVSSVNHRFPMIKRRDTFLIPEELTSEIFSDGDFHIQEERRLFYVAVTRARRRLFVTYSDQYDGNKKWKVSPFIAELSESGDVEFTDHEPSDNAFERLKALKAPKKPVFELPKFEKKRLSYSQIDTFKTCPLKYNYRYLLKVPVPPSHAANFGSGVHNTLNEFYQHVKTGKEVSIELMKELYEKHWIPLGYETKSHENARKKSGWEILKQFYETNSDPWVVPAYLERPFNLRVGEHMISGRIDRVDKLDDGTYEIIDYKTGRLKKGVNLNKDLQLSIYALACRDVFRIPVSKLSLYYLEDNEKVSTTRSNEQIEEVLSNIDVFIEDMKKSGFEPTPGFLCQFCEYRLICPAV